MITTTTRYHSIKRRKITMTVVYHVLVAAAQPGHALSTVLDAFFFLQAQ